MSEYSLQRDAIAAIVATVPDIGRVHDRPRYGDAATNWVANIGSINQVRAWEIGLADPGRDQLRRDQGWQHRYTYWLIRGYVSVIDTPLDEADDADFDRWSAASYSTIIDLAEQVGDALDADRQLTATCIDHDPVETSEPDAVFIGGSVLTWTITLRMRAWTVRQI